VYVHHIIGKYRDGIVAGNIGVFIMLGTPNDRLKELQITLPVPCQPAGNYRPAHIVGKYLYVSGHTPDDANPNCVVGKVTGKFGETAPPKTEPCPAPEPSRGRKLGRVKWFNTVKGYGFIAQNDGGKDLFVHISAVERAGLSSLHEGQEVEYDEVMNRGKTSAENLRLRDRNAPPPPPPEPPKRTPGTVTPEQGYNAAREVALAVLSTVEHAVGLGRVKRLVKATGLVNCTDDFTQHPKVMNGFSDLMAKVFGDDAGVGTRSATGANSLPGNVPVEVTECVFELKPAVRAPK
jgi:cold shock CspA family protein/enamine deaminase RidA (YjgF/YER057c/UK114 family)